ncbi:MAG: molybdopterin-dependent oxidoreductase [Bacteroidetes bacterium]|nr:molybdopterin-dependent oxidoreductase [Bacteroidota bacterium]
MNPETAPVNVTIDNRSITAAVGTSILQVARENDIYIPTLCFHESLSPHGGCRMCIVEVEGLRTFPTACTTPIDEGMIIRTHTAQIQEMRTEILQLFLSEHTASCLVCGEKVECREYMSTVRKAGVTTGCRYCPKDGQCELQAVTESLDVNEIIYPIYYRGINVETGDPFYDRDYNLCILCGRCVRMCQEVRLADVLAYKHRGRKTIIGPAFSRTHLDSGCEFCGACVSVCPTGTLREKARAWEGKPEREETTTCSFCGVGCQVKLLVKEDRIIGSLPADDPLVNQGQLCVKGRFCNTELVNGHQRVKNPYRHEGAISWDVSWNEAFALIAEKLQASSPDRVGMLVSPNLCTEDLYIAQKFMRVALASHHVDTTARLFYGAGFNAYLGLMKRAVPLAAIQNASVVLMIGLDTRFSRSVVGVALRTAMKKGIEIVTLNPREHTISLKANLWLQPGIGTEFRYVDMLAQLTRGAEVPADGISQVEREKLEQTARMLSGSSNPVILVGAEYLQYDSSRELLESVAQLADNIGAGIMPLPAQNNLYGSLLAGSYPELLPGMRSTGDDAQRKLLEAVWGTSLSNLIDSWTAASLVACDTPLQFLYAVGEVPPPMSAPADFMVFQNMYPPEPYGSADLVLPSAAATEVDGTFINGERRMQRVRRAVVPLGNALPDWEILCRLGRFMGATGFEFSRPEEIREEIARAVPEFTQENIDARTPMPFVLETDMREFTNDATAHHAAERAQTDSAPPFLFHASVIEHTHRGFPLSAWVDGAKLLFPEGTLTVNVEDAKALQLTEGDVVRVSGASFERTWPVRLASTQPRGTLHASLLETASSHPNPQPVAVRKADV